MRDSNQYTKKEEVLISSRYYLFMNRLSVLLVFYAFLLSSSLVSFSAFAQDTSSEKEEPKLTPNLTVTISLNSNLSQAENAYYKKIVEKFLSSFPDEVELQGEYARMMRSGSHMDKLNVVAYLPALEGEESSSGLDKDIRFYSIPFKVPSGLGQEKNMAKNFDDEAIVLHRDPYKDFLRSIDKSDPDLKELEVTSTSDDMDMSAKKEESAGFETELAKIVAAGSLFDEDLNKAAKQPAKPTPPKESMKKDSSLSTGKKHSFRLAYFGDETKPREADLEKLSDFAKTLKGKGGKVSMIVQSLPSLSETSAEVGKSRVSAILQSLGSSKLEVSQMILKAEGKQFIDFDYTPE